MTALKQTIRIGTMVRGAKKANSIRQILPHGFESFELDFWKTIGNVNLARMASELAEILSETGSVISCIGIYGNPLENDPDGQRIREDWKKCIDAAHLFGCDLVTGFAGRLRGKPIPASIKTFGKIFSPLAKRAADKGVRIAFENCGDNWNAGDWNIAISPPAWEMMFNELPGDNVGLEWEPCHQMRRLIDPLPQLRKWAKKIFHVHGKDATVLWDVVRDQGIVGPHEFAFARTPGFGDTNWANIISELRRAGFQGSIDIEGWHDPVFKDELEMTGQVHALNYLKSCRRDESYDTSKRRDSCRRMAHSAATDTKQKLANEKNNVRARFNRLTAKLTSELAGKKYS